MQGQALKKDGEPGLRLQAAGLRRSPTEREVLRVLWSRHGQDHLVRSDIFKRMPQAHRPTLGRVGQILATLYKDGYVEKVEQRSQGSRTAGFYALTPRGRELCSKLGFQRDERLLFRATEKVLRTCLTPKRLARCPEEASGNIIAVYGYQGGLGKTTLAAHVSHGLGQKLASRGQLLVVDLDLRAPGLDAFFAPHGLGKCRGLGGLLVDFERQAARKRPLWLLGALSSPEYVLRPMADVPGLVYLPSGLSPGQNALGPSGRAEALAALRAEPGVAAATDRSDPDRKAPGFLSELRVALMDKFKRTVIDTEAGHSLGAWIGTQALADELVVCAKMTDTSPATIAGLRSVIACFLDVQRARSCAGGSTFLFRLEEPTASDKFGHWLEQHLVMDNSESITPKSYRAEQLPYEARLAAHSHRWEYTHFFAPLIALLERPGPTNGVKVVPPELQALLTVLDPTKPSGARSIAAGILENAPLQELVRWATYYVGDEAPKMATDTRGEELVKTVVRIQSERLLSKILRQL